MARIDTTTYRQVSWPELPYLGLRRFDASDRLLYCGRDNDLEACLRHLASPAVRVLALQGLSGSGKSSFLRACLIPALEDPRRQTIVPICGVVSVRPDMFRTIARQVYDFVIKGAGRTVWPDEAKVIEGKYSGIDDFVGQASEKVEVLIEFLSELGNDPWKSALIAIDQVEDLWSMAMAPASKALREQFLQLVNEFALERLSGRLVLAIRTEQYGLFASRLPISTMPAYAGVTGVNRLSHHFLGSPSRDELIALVEYPTSHYGFRFEDGLPELIVDGVQRLAQEPETCVLPLLQVVLARLYIEGREGWRDADLADAFVISNEAFRTILQAADNSPTGLLGDFVRWGVGRAVARVFEHESSSDPLLSRSIEVSRWLTVLKEMSTLRGGVRVGVQKNLVEIEHIAKANECEVQVPRMIESLVDPEIALLVRLENSENFALRHDLICLTFDHQADSPALEFSEQTVYGRQQRINKAAEYGLQDLFGDNPPALQKLRVAELRFWDHKMLAYATHAKFFQRLGFDVESMEFADNVSATELVAKLTDGTHHHAVYSFPRSLMSTEEQWANQDVVVLNSFAGFAVICNANAGLHRLEDDISWERFESCIGSLLALSSQKTVHLWHEDQGAKDFFNSILDIARLRKGERWQDAIEVVSRLMEPAQSEGPEIVGRMLGERRPCVAVVTAPTWATAGMVGGRITTVLDHRSVLGLIDQVRDGTKSAYADVRRKLNVRNVMNIHPTRDASQAELDPLLMRLASIGLFLSEFVWASESLASEWIRKRWNELEHLSNNHSVRMSAPAFQRTFRRSYHYTTANEHSDIYFGAEWPNDCAGALAIHHKLMRARMAYQTQTAALTAFGAGARVPDDIRALVERAHRHAEIFNYFDAQRLLDQASQKLSVVPSG